MGAGHHEGLASADLSQKKVAHLSSERIMIEHLPEDPPAEGESLPTGCHGLENAVNRSRREALRIGGLSLLGTSLPSLLAARDAAPKSSAASSTSSLPGFGSAKRCIFLFMWGGPAQQDTWDMKPEAPVEYRGEFSPIATNVPGIQICEHMPLLGQRTDKLAILRAVTHGDVNHTTGTHELLTGYSYRPGQNERQTSPHIGTVLARLGWGNGPLPPVVNMMPKVPGTVPRFVEQSQGQGAGWLGPIYDPMLLMDDPNLPEFQFGHFKLHEEITRDRLSDRQRLVAEIDRQSEAWESALQRQALGAHYERAYELLTARDALRAFRIDEEPDKTRDRYGRNPHGQAVLLARRLAEANVPMSTVFWQNDGLINVSVYWDTHNRNFIDLKTRLMPVTDLAFSALLDDLELRGLLDETLVVWTGEFGRTPRVGQGVVGGAGAGRDGRDHWPHVFTTVLAGAGIKRGIVHGSSDRYAAYPSANPTRPADIAATIYHCLGVDPHITLPDRLDRPIPICDGEPIAEILA